MRQLGKVILFMIFIVMLHFPMNSFSQDPNVYVYLCFGQSNMEGQATPEAQDQTGIDARFQNMSAVSCSPPSRTQGTLYSAVPPLCRCNTGLSPSDYFGRTMVTNLPTNIKVVIVNVSVAGCKIELFDKVNYKTYASTVAAWMTTIINQYGGNPYGKLVEVAKQAQKLGVIKGILLHQGESNTGETDWPTKVKGIYDNLITDLGLTATKVPLLVGELRYQDQGGSCYSHNTVIAKVPATIPNSYVISASGIPGTSADTYHFNAAGYRTLGARYAQQMLALMEPYVSITSPVNNSTFNVPTTISITATVKNPNPNGTISKVDFYNGTTKIGTSTTSPYSFSWTNVAKGTYYITAVATNSNGKVGTSINDTLIVNGTNVSPTVSITSPVNNATFTAPTSVIISATANDADGTISKVEFYNGTTLLGTATTSPYTFTWSNIVAGTYSITAVATDNSASKTTSLPISIVVSAAPVSSVSLVAGWNYIGCPLTGGTPLASALASIWANVETIKNQDEFYAKANPTALNSLTQVKWGSGYLVKITNACVLDWIVK